MRQSRATYLVLALALFATEVVIATALQHWPFVRGSLGDVLVTSLVYCTALAIRDFERLRLGVGVFLFACLVESAQYFHVAAALGLAKGSALRIAIGDSFQWGDIVCYFVGCVVTFVIDTAVWRRLSTREQSPP